MIGRLERFGHALAPSKLIRDQINTLCAGAVDLRQMSIQQGAVLLKLIDRETGVPPYEIIKTYKNGAAAVFWQGVAKMFENDLKSAYDPTGADALLEELVQIWQRGEFRDFYWSLFWEEPPVVEVPERYKR